MKKHSLYFTLLAFAAFLVILSACGDGDVVPLPDTGTAQFNLENAIEDCLKGKPVANFDCEALKEKGPNQGSGNSSSNPNSSSSTTTIIGNISCELPTGTYAVGDNVPAPTLTCAEDAGGDVRGYGRVYEGDIPENSNQWGNANNGVYTTPGVKNITLKKAVCGNTTHDDQNVACTGTLNIKSLDDLEGVSCSFEKDSYSMGESFTPVLTCPTGYELITYNMVYQNGADGGGWANYNTVGHYKTAGEKEPIATIKCKKGNVITPIDKSCGVITITKPTCTLPESGKYGTTNVPPPTVMCGATKSDEHSREYVGTNDGDLPLYGAWNSANNGNYSFAGEKGPITLKKVTCSGSALDNLNVPCTGPGSAITFTILP